MSKDILHLDSAIAKNSGSEIECELGLLATTAWGSKWTLGIPISNLQICLIIPTNSSHTIHDSISTHSWNYGKCR